MNHQLLDLYSDYLLSSFSATTATGLSAMLDGDVSHDQITRLLSSPRIDARQWWLMVKPSIRKIQSETAVISVDDSILEKPHTDENDLISWHFDHTKGRTVKGINFITSLYEAKGITLPLAYRLVEKTQVYTDKHGIEKRRSPVTKNEHYRAMLQQCHNNQVPFAYVLNDSWFAAADNMRFVKLDLKREFIMAMKKNRKVALSSNDKANGEYKRLDELDLPEAVPTKIYLERVPFVLHVLRQVFKNEDDSTGIRYLVTSDLTLAASQLTTIFQRRWKVEEYHRSLKQNASLAKSPTRTKTTQSNHFAAALWAYTKLELLKVQTKKNHYTLKTKLYLKALRTAFDTLQSLSPARLAHLSA